MDVFIFDLESRNNSNINLNVEPLDYLIVHVVWRDDDHLYLRKTDRIQTEDYILIVQVGISQPQIIPNPKKDNGWLDPSNIQHMFFLASGDSFVELRENNDYIQIGLFDSNNGNLIRWLTDQQSAVTNIIAYDKSRDKM